MADTTPTPPNRVTAAQRLFIEHEPGLRAYINSLVPDFSRAQDVLQETFLTVTSKAGDFVPGSNFLGWACTIARYKVLEALRQQKFIGLSVAAVEALCVCEAAVPENPRTDLLTQCIEDLAPKARQIITLRYKGSHSPSEVAHIVGWTPDAVYVALNRARRFLQDCITRKLAALRET